jgi:hypothetical protein
MVTGVATEVQRNSGQPSPERGGDVWPCHEGVVTQLGTRSLRRPLPSVREGPSDLRGRYKV